MQEYNYINEIFLMEAFTPNPDSIADAVKNKRLISIYYKGAEEGKFQWRQIMPVCFGEDMKGRQALRAFQLDEPTTTFVPAWKFFLVERISNWNMSSNKNFDKPKDNYNPKDKHMRKIFASSNFNEKVNAKLPTSLDVLQGTKTHVVDMGKKKSVKSFDKPEDAVDYAAKMNKGAKASNTSGFKAFSDKELAKMNVSTPGVQKSKNFAKRLKTLEEIYASI
jgi:hypothetical protein